MTDLDPSGPITTFVGRLIGSAIMASFLTSWPHLLVGEWWAWTVATTPLWFIAGIVIERREQRDLDAFIASGELAAIIEEGRP